jgi:hypothetical protein
MHVLGSQERGEEREEEKKRVRAAAAPMIAEDDHDGVVGHAERAQLVHDHANVVVRVRDGRVCEWEWWPVGGEQARTRRVALTVAAPPGAQARHVDCAVERGVLLHPVRVGVPAARCEVSISWPAR